MYSALGKMFHILLDTLSIHLFYPLYLNGLASSSYEILCVYGYAVGSKRPTVYLHKRVPKWSERIK